MNTVDLKDEYRTETNEDVYSEDTHYGGTGSYSDEYVKWLESKLNNNDVSGTVWVVQDTMNGMIAGMFDSQIKAIKYTDKSKGMAIINMEVI